MMAAWQVEDACQKFAAGGIGLSVNRRLAYFYFQGAVLEANDGIAG